MKKYSAIGLMSGTSLDGLDLVFAEFSMREKWHFKIIDATTVPYDETWIEKLSHAFARSPSELEELHREYGIFLGRQTAKFIRDTGRMPDLIASHGHTIHHRPEEGITVQIGAGEEITKECGVPVVYDFRSEDVKNGGQGAPLVPIGDELLFDDYAACVNLGGFANISMRRHGERIAWDICPVNFVMNAIMRTKGKAYDKDGESARNGVVDSMLLEQFNRIDYYFRPPPKSLGREWVDENIRPLINDYKGGYETLLRTFVEHVATQIGRAVGSERGKVLFTGGGTFNKFLMEKIEEKTAAEIVIPDRLLIDFKEALIFAFMGVLRMENMVNVFGSVTGSGKDISAGKVVWSKIL